MARTSTELPLHIPAGRCRRTEPCCAQQCPVQARDFRQKEWLCDSISVLPVCSENRKARLQPGWVSSAPFPPAVDLAESKQTWHTLLKCQGPRSQAPQHCHRALLLSPCCGGIQSPAPNAAAAHQPHGPPASGAKPCNAECSCQKKRNTERLLIDLSVQPQRFHRVYSPVLTRAVTYICLQKESIPSKLWCLLFAVQRQILRD